MVYDIIYDETTGEPIDAILRESTSNYETLSTKITKGLSYANFYNNKTRVTEGTFREFYLKTEYQATDFTRSSYLYNIKNSKYFAIIRPLLKDENGNYTGTYYDVDLIRDNSSPTAYICGDRTIKNYDLTKSTLSRLNYSGIDIEKTVDAFNNSGVSLNSSLEYSIKIKNDSNSDYKAFDVIENISEYADIEDRGDGNINGNTITWQIENLKAGDSIEIKYKVKVKANPSLLGEKIISTGTVADIPSATITNTISSNLNILEKDNISSTAQRLINSKEFTEQEFIRKIYSDALDVDLNISDFNILDLIKTSPKITYNPSNLEDDPAIYLNKENSFSNMLVSDYYGALYNGTNNVYLKYWENTNPKIKGRHERADTIYKGNLQTGDILIYQNTQEESDSVKYKTEDGTYYLVYLDEENKITINGENFYGFIGLNENGEINNLYRDESDYETSTDYLESDLRTLLGKDYYVILRPSMTLDIVPMELTVSYSTIEKTNQDVQVVITANEEILPIEGWTLSEDKKVLTKTYKENTEENITIYDLAGNKISYMIKISNIEKKLSNTVTQVFSNNDITTAKIILPNAGKKSIAIFIAIFIVISAFMGIKLKKYKDIK